MASPDNDGKLRPWRQIATELAVEQDPKRVLDLSKELNKALEAQGMDLDTEQHEKESGSRPGTA